MVILTAIALIEWIWRYPDIVGPALKKYGLLTFTLLLCPFLTSYWWGGIMDSSYWWGGIEKHHGYILYMSIVTLGVILGTLPAKEKMQYIHISIWSAVIVAIVAISQYLDGSTLQSRYPGRSISTLGNPNYLAGYLLMIIPLIHRVRSPERWMIGTLISLALISTGSYIGIALLGCYLLYLFICKMFQYFRVPSRRFLVLYRYVIVCSLSFVGIWMAYYWIDTEKLLSLTSRFILMKESFIILLHDPLSLFIGFGPDSLASHFSITRSSLVSAYFPNHEIIDSSHNILIDITFQYGILPIGIIGYTLWQGWGNKKEDVQAAILLGVLFLSLNVFVVVHLILFVLLWSYRDLSLRKNISEK